MIDYQDVHDLFLNRHARDAVRTMRRHGMNETMISGVIQDLRAAVLQTEWNRQEQLRTMNFPKTPSHGEIAKIMRDAEITENHLEE